MSKGLEDFKKYIVSSTCNKLSEVEKDNIINYFIDKHQDYLDEQFVDDVDYQNAQRDIGEIEYITFNDPESIIYEMQYDWCKEHLKDDFLYCACIEYNFDRIFRKGGDK